MSSSRGGMRSSVKGTCGSIEMIDLVRKSSGVIIGVVRAENDFAADRKARNETVRFDLKADLRGGSTRILEFSCSLGCGLSKTLKSSSSMSISGTDNGWSSTAFSTGGEESVRRVGKDRLPLGLGVTRELRDGEASLTDSLSNDGIDSHDTVLVDKTDS